MLKLVACEQLRPGMFVHDLNRGWGDHPFLLNRFKIKNDKQIAEILAAGIREVYIDTERGRDAPEAIAESEVKAQIEQEMTRVARATPTPSMRQPLAAEMSRAQKIHEQAGQTVREVLRDARLGKAIEIDNVEAVVHDITASLTRNSGALLSLLRLKDADNYTFLHCVAVGTFMVTFARSMDLDAETVGQAGIGGMLHDVGKMQVPDAILNKPGKLTDAEFALIKRHPAIGHELLLQSGVVGPLPLDITLHHHERIDGSGYPDKLPGERISLLTKMASIVDVYDAITSDRCYHRGIAPTEALRKMFEWSKTHQFEETLVHQFMRCVGIYPVGTLVKLESGRLAVVVEQTAGNLLAPKVKAVFSTRSNCYIVPEVIDLARAMGHGGADRIVGHELPDQWGIDPGRFLA
jgi:HD-GYP domain-containing protein (c-di-GMP phosphodiesterase class II)